MRLLLVNMDNQTIAIKNGFKGRTALHVAILNNSHEFAEVLIQKMRVQDLAVQETGMVIALAIDVSEEMQDMVAFAELIVTLWRR